MRRPNRDSVWGAALALLTALGPAGCEVPELEFEYQRTADTEAVEISGVPEEVEAFVSVDGSAPEPFPKDGIVELPHGLTGRVAVSVAWQTGTIVTTRGHGMRYIDLDEERAKAVGRRLDQTSRLREIAQPDPHRSTAPGTTYPPRPDNAGPGSSVESTRALSPTLLADRGRRRPHRLRFVALEHRCQLQP
jgi:hypothetical protein